MLVLRSPEATSRIAASGIRDLIELRFTQVGAGEIYNANLHGPMVLVEPGDTVEALEAETGCPILRNTFDDARFGDLEFTPAAEVIEEHPDCYELVYILNDDGFGVAIFVPKVEGIDPSLLLMCATYAVPASKFEAT